MAVRFVWPEGKRGAVTTSWDDGTIHDRGEADAQSDKLLYLWGHSYEFPRDGNWDLIESFCDMAGAADWVWHATNMEIFDYVIAWRHLLCSIECTSLRNRSGLSLWCEVDGELMELAPGAAYRIQTPAAGTC